jgi:hypothetical protein
MILDKQVFVGRGALPGLKDGLAAFIWTVSKICLSSMSLPGIIGPEACGKKHVVMHCSGGRHAKTGGKRTDNAASGRSHRPG